MYFVIISHWKIACIFIWTNIYPLDPRYSQFSNWFSVSSPQLKSANVARQTFQSATNFIVFTEKYTCALKGTILWTKFSRYVKSYFLIKKIPNMCLLKTLMFGLIQSGGANYHSIFKMTLKQFLNIKYRT